MEITVKARKWGKALAFVLPKSVTQRELLRPDDEIIVEIKRSDRHERLFGILEGKSVSSTQCIKDEMREGWQ